MSRKNLWAMLLVLTVGMASGCMAMFQEKMGHITVVTMPPGATVSYGYEKVTTPAPLMLPRDRPVVILVSKKGYEPVQIPINPQADAALWAGSVLLNATHGFFTLGISFVLGLVYDATSGVLNSFEAGVLTVRLRPEY